MPQNYMTYYASPALCQRHDSAFRRAGVVRQWSDEAVVGQLLDDVCRPTGDARHHENGGEYIDVNPHKVVGGAGVEIQVGIDALLLNHRFGKDVTYRQPLLLAREVGHLASVFEHGRATGVAFLVNAMAETHDLPLFPQDRQHPVAGARRLADV